MHNRVERSQLDLASESFQDFLRLAFVENPCQLVGYFTDKLLIRLHPLIASHWMDRVHPPQFPSPVMEFILHWKITRSVKPKTNKSSSDD